MNTKDLFIKAAIVGVTAAGLASGGTALASGSYTHCFGIHSCSGKGKCGLSQAEIDAAKKAFPNNKAFASAKPHSCAGKNGMSGSCGGMKSLAWSKTKSKGECLSKGGFVIEKGKVIKGKKG